MVCRDRGLFPQDAKVKHAFRFTLFRLEGIGHNADWQYIFIRHNTDGQGEEAAVASSLLRVKTGGKGAYFTLIQAIRRIRKILHLNFISKFIRPRFLEK